MSEGLSSHVHAAVDVQRVASNLGYKTGGRVCCISWPCSGMDQP